MQSRLPAVSYEGVTLGAEPKFGFQEVGFYLPERFLGVPGRWTNGDAALKVGFGPANPPQLLEIETMVPGRDGAQLQVLANRIELWNQRVPPDLWSKTFKLEHVPLNKVLLIELISDTFSPGEKHPDSEDKRRLGVAVTRIRLTARDHFDDRPGTRNKNE
jgi:hypothetical protein